MMGPRKSAASKSELADLAAYLGELRWAVQVGANVDQSKCVVLQQKLARLRVLPQYTLALLRTITGRYGSYLFGLTAHGPG
jgi:hypothetical protein